MTQPIYSDTPAGFLAPDPATFIAASTTKGKVLVEQYAASAAVGSLPSYYGGATVLDILASSTDGSARDVQLYIATVKHTITTGVGGTDIDGAQIIKNYGSWITDGFKVGDLFMAFGPANQAPNADDGILGIVTSVTTTALGFNGTPYSNVGDYFAVGTRLCKLSPRVRASVPANSGNGTLPNVSFLNNSQDTAQCRFEQKLGPDNLLIAAMPVAVSALPAYVSLQAVIARY